MLALVLSGSRLPHQDDLLKSCKIDLTEITVISVQACIFANLNHVISALKLFKLIKSPSIAYLITTDSRHATW